MEDTPSRSITSRIIPILVLAVAAWILFKFAFGFIAWLATVVVIIGAIAAVIWAVRRL
jgi:accessory gene regulator protein AgrB